MEKVLLMALLLTLVSVNSVKSDTAYLFAKNDQAVSSLSDSTSNKEINSKQNIATYLKKEATRKNTERTFYSGCFRYRTQTETKISSKEFAWELVGLTVVTFIVFSVIQAMVIFEKRLILTILVIELAFVLFCYFFVRTTACNYANIALFFCSLTSSILYIDGDANFKKINRRYRRLNLRRSIMFLLLLSLCLWSCSYLFFGIAETIGIILGLLTYYPLLWFQKFYENFQKEIWETCRGIMD